MFIIVEVIWVLYEQKRKSFKLKFEFQTLEVWIELFKFELTSNIFKVYIDLNLAIRNRILIRVLYFKIEIKWKNIRIITV